MGKFALTSKGVKKIHKMLEKQLVETEKAFVKEAYSYFVNFAYHIVGANPTPGGGGWTLNYLANWNVSINQIDTGIYTSPDRDEVRFQKEYFKSQVDYNKAITVCKKLHAGDSVSVTNSVEYGEILNNGGVLGGIPVAPARFIEKCQNELANKADEIIKEVERNCPSL